MASAKRCRVCHFTPEQVTVQRHDSLDAQLRDLVAVGNRMGCWDAADWIYGILTNPHGPTRAEDRPA